MGDHLLNFTGTAMLIIGIYLVWALAHTHTKVDRIERKLNLVLRHAGLEVDEAARREAQELLRAGKKIAAIKAYRQYTGCSLREAKSEIERLQAGGGSA